MDTLAFDRGVRGEQYDADVGRAQHGFPSQEELPM
jgi:hypothetical protein